MKPMSALERFIKAGEREIERVHAGDPKAMRRSLFANIAGGLVLIAIAIGVYLLLAGR
jgi:hypothetical protein